MELSTKSFFILDALDRYEITTQRQLSERSGISLGHVNHILKDLLQKGLVRTDDFFQSPNKKHGVYLLTPKGLDAKSRLASRFVVSKLKEYSQFKRYIVDKLTIIESKGNTNIFFVGPEIVKDFVDKTIKDFSLNLVMVGYCNQLEELESYETDSYDIALVLDDNSLDKKALAKATGFPGDKLLPLW
ncbi:MAG: winged helix-turn-helix transcriptional regulator [Desulfobacterales bacterium]|nr:MAG: winged helix-turn-helix transcriptional regulator [Desulfobacterales bacterium]UCD90971.1 MAG: winged helix-turn-helix transcriptional regulator [Desulfobacterales bacterium]